MAKKYYAVRRGRQTGIFTDWPTTQRMVSGFSNPVFKGFQDRQAAVRFLHPNRTVSHSHSIVVYTDGGSRNHGNHRHQHVLSTDRSAWAYLVKIGSRRSSGTGAEWGATNNRMETMALVKALEFLLRHHLNRQAILEVADSRYVLNVLTKGWLASWRRRDWRLSNGQPVKNASLWKVMARLVKAFPTLRFKWTKGHANNAGNNFVDHLLNRTMDQMNRKSLVKPKRARSESKNKGPNGPDSVEEIKKSLKRLGYLKD